MTDLFARARTFVYRNARPLDLARFRLFFEHGAADDVLTALACYRNADGGFGHALEADAWNPLSTPMQTWVATEILREAGVTDRAHPLVRGIVRYLGSGADFDGHFWYKIVRSNADCPHAPWWHTERDTAADGDYNPTAALAGFLVRFAGPGSAEHALGCRLAREAAAQLLAGTRAQPMHTLVDFVQMAEYLEEADAPPPVDLPAVWTALRTLVNDCMTRDTAEWAEGYICRPSRFISGPDSRFYPDNRALAAFECDWLVRTQLPDGSWRVNWSWDAYPAEWAVAKNWWKTDGILTNLLFLRAFGKL